MGNESSKSSEPEERPPPFRKPAKERPPPESKPATKQKRHRNMMFSERKKLTLGKGRINVCVIKGDLTQEKVDVIVCTANKPLDLSKGRSSRTLLEAAGDGLSDEVRSSYPDGIDYGEIAVVNSGKLDCKKVYFVALPVAGTSHDDKQILHDTVTTCLEMADQAKFKSLSIPALGTGLLKYSNTIVAAATIQSVEDFSNSNPDTSVKYVNCVVYYQDDQAFTAFEEEARGRAGQPINHNGVMSPAGAASASRMTVGVRSIMRGINYGGPQKAGCLGNINVEVVIGKLADFKADVLVSNCSKDLNLTNGGLAESLLEKAGSELQDECNQTYPNGIRQGHVAVTKGYNLNCKFVFHGSLPNWDNKGLTAKKALCRFICNCLQEAEDKNLTSIAIPALGTGSMKFPAKVSAEQTFQCISKFVNSHQQGTKVKRISIIVYDGAADCKVVKQAFEEALKETLQENVDSDADEDDNDAVQRNVQMKLLQIAAKNSLERTCAADRGTQDWFKFMYKSEPKSPGYWAVFHSRKTLKDWGLEAHSRPFIRVPLQGEALHDVERLVLDTWDAQHVGHGRDAQGLGGLNYTNIRVTKVERIENYELFHKYAVKRQELFKKALNKGGPFKTVEHLKGSKGKVLTTSKIGSNSVLSNEVYDEVNEYYMFHGTDVVDKIVEQGLDCRLAGQHAMFGQGVYCAESSTKSDQYADPKGMRSLTDRKMLLVRTCLGEPFITSTGKSYARPPCKSCQEDKCQCSNNQFYDSVIGDGSWNFREFVVYSMNDVYPEYIITYNRV